MRHLRKDIQSKQGAMRAAGQRFREKYRILQQIDSEEVPDPIDLTDPKQQKWARWFATQRTPEGLSFLARHLLGCSWWKLQHHAKAIHDHKSWPMWCNGMLFHECGLVAYGPHRRMFAALSRSRDVILFCSRNGNKTWHATVECIQMILRDPRVRILVYMATKSNAGKTVQQMKGLLTRSEITLLFGEQEGESWGKLAFTVKQHESDQGRERNETVTATGAWATDVGSRCDVLWVDDPVDERWIDSPDRIEKAKTTYQAISPLVDPGGRTIITLTPYADNDFAAWVMQPENSRSFTIVCEPCGYEAKHDEIGRKYLFGRQAFPRLTYAYLDGILQKMTVQQFNKNYFLRLDSNDDTIFRREDFVAERWEPRISQLQSYILTDTAATTNKEGCLSVIALVAVDWDRTIYVMDMVCGRWVPTDVIAKIVDMIVTWRAPSRGAMRMANLNHVVMEKVMMNAIYRPQIEDDLRRRGHAISFIELPRGASSTDEKGQNDTKRNRIRSLQPVVRQKQLRFVEEAMTKKWDDRGKEKLIYGSMAYTDQTGARVPGGEIPDQFLRWRDTLGYKGLMDIPDCLSAVTQLDTRGNHMIPSSPKPVEPVRQTPFQPFPAAHAMRQRRGTLFERLRR